MTGADVKKLREDQGLTQEEFAKRIMYTQAQVSRWENDKTPVPRPMIELIRLLFYPNEKDAQQISA
ncbi:MAG: helix-turn-helix domain-containing protein [Proteobacteria bacterium]|nr:helix-turn-helix domain-containing protein [Pseudomonadota bacterium]